jgi:hypothetical protein
MIKKFNAHEYDYMASSLSFARQAPASHTQALWQAGLTY